MTNQKQNKKIKIYYRDENVKVLADDYVDYIITIEKNYTKKDIEKEKLYREVDDNPNDYDHKTISIYYSEKEYYKYKDLDEKVLSSSLSREMTRKIISQEYIYRDMKWTNYINKVCKISKITVDDKIVWEYKKPKGCK